MNRQHLLRTTLLVSLLTALTACSAAKWSEDAGRSPNGASGAPGGGSQSPHSQAASESFQQDANANKVDILIVNDNSFSMEDEQSKMASRFKSFVGDLKGVDYRIAMTTTDIDSPKHHQDGKIVTWSGWSTTVLTPATPNAATKFENTIRRKETIGCGQRGDCPSGNEQPLRATELAIDQATTANKDLFRNGVDFVVVVLSDEDEMSNGPASATTADHVLAHFRGAFGTTKRFVVHGLVVVPGDDQCLAAQRSQGHGGETYSYFGTHVAALASLTGGSVHSICDADYAKDLASISSSVRSLISSFDLAKTPIENSVTVVLSPAFKTSWHVEQNRVIFNPPPPAGTKIEINYQY